MTFLIVPIVVVPFSHRARRICEDSGASLQAALRGMAAMLCGLRYGADDHLVPLDGPAA